MGWIKKWELDTSVSPESGGQGVVSRVRRRTDGTFGALKLLPNEVRASERRARFSREVEALKKLTHPSVPKVLDYEFPENPSIENPCFAVFEWIDGSTLQRVSGGRPHSIDEALRLVSHLARVIEQIHSAGVMHRDIKPDNIMIRADQLVLVDFGIAWIEDLSAEEDLTGHAQELGNRFLRIPDLGAGGAQRDFRSDLTFIVGVLFFLLTGCAPRHLADEKGRPPHESLKDRFPPQTVDDLRWRRIQSIFQIGFQANIGLRFQIAADLIRHIEEAQTIPGSNAESRDAASALDRYQLARRRSDAAVEIVENSLTTSLDAFREAFNLFASRNGFSVIPGKASIVATGRRAKLLYQLTKAQHSEPYVFVGIYLTLEGEQKSYVVATMETEHPSRDGELKHAFYRGPSADIARLIEEIVIAVPDVFSVALDLLTRRLEAGA